MIKNLAQELGNGYCKVEVTSNGSMSAIGTATLAVEYNKAVATYSAAHSLSIGDLIFIQGSTYKVKSVTSTTVVVLTTPYKGNTLTALATSTNYLTGHGKITTATKFGLRFTGIANPFDVNRWRNYYVNRFTVTVSSGDKATLVQGAFEGLGVWQKVAMDEYMTYGFEGQNEMMAVPPTPRTQLVQTTDTNGSVDTNKYSMIEIVSVEKDNRMLGTSNFRSVFSIYLNLDQTSPLGVVPASTAEETLILALGFTRANLAQVN